jgi:PAS domain S-box-containing protein
MKKKVLVIDDKKDNLISITALLNSYLPGCEIITALSGAEGIELVKKEEPDTILLDIIMPKMDGYEVCKRLKEDESTKHIPVIMLTAIMTDTVSHVKGLEIGADAFLSKPIETIKLIGQINVMLRIKEAEDKLRADKDLLEQKVLNRTEKLERTNTKLKNSESLLKKSQEISDIGSWEVDFISNKSTWSDHYYKLLGYEESFENPDQSIFLSHVYKKDLAEVNKTMQRAIDNKEPTTMEFRFTRKNGDIRNARSQSEFKIDDNGNICKIIGIFQDITESKLAEEIRKESEEKFRSLVNNSPDIIMRIDSKGVINYINYEYSNQKPEDILGQTIYDLIPTDFHEVANSTIKKVFETGESYRFENLGIGNAAEVLWHQNNIAAISKNGKVVAATIITTDITEHKQAELLQTEFVASVSHELRTPITIIRESLSLLSDGLLGELNSDQLGIVNPCMEDVDRLARILNNLLGISQSEGHKITLEREMFDIVRLAKSTVSSFKNQAASKNIELVFTPSCESINLYIDRDRMIQVFMNLIGNAIKFTEKGKIEISITENEDSVVCCIADTGRGIEQKDLGTLFDRFHQVGKIMSAGEKGSGLGLSIVKGLVKSHKGKVWVNSEINKGSKFFFSLPRFNPEGIILEHIDKEIKIITGKHMKRTLTLIRLNSYSDIESNLGVKEADKVTNQIFQLLQDDLAPGDFSFIKKKNEVILFSDITRQNINILNSKLEDMLSESAAKNEKDIKVDLSFNCSVYPDNGNNARELLWDVMNEYIK